MSRVRDAALLVRAVAYGETDGIYTFLTESHGKVGVIARGARKGSKRFGGALEPIHSVTIDYEDSGKELCALKEASIVRPRLAVLEDVLRIQLAGTAIMWTRSLCPPRTPEPAVFHALTWLLDRLDEGARLGDDPGYPPSDLVTYGLRLLTAVGFGLELDRCVRCGRLCPPERSACVDGARGGLLCQGCGGSPTVLKPELRAKVKAAHHEDVEFDMVETGTVDRLVGVALAAHAEIA